MKKYILPRLVIIVAITILATFVFLLLFEGHEDPLGTLIYSMVTGFVLAILYSIFLCVESFFLFRSGKIIRGIINLVIGLILLAVSLYFTDYYFYKCFLRAKFPPMSE